MEWKSVLYLNNEECKYSIRYIGTMNVIYVGLINLRGCGTRATLTIL